jgi:hypothetical protein
MSGQLVGSLMTLLVVVLADAWVFLDATARAGRARPVVATIGNLTLETPTVWLLGCVVLWVLFFPMYLVARSRS